MATKDQRRERVSGYQPPGGFGIEKWRGGMYRGHEGICRWDIFLGQD